MTQLPYRQDNRYLARPETPVPYWWYALLSSWLITDFND